MAIKEAAIVKEVINYFGITTDQIVTEVGFQQRRVDIVAYKETNNLLIATEAKVKNWKAAIKQAITCLQFADEVFIAMPESYIHLIDKKVLEKYGIGLMKVNSTVEVVLQPAKSKYASEYHRDWVLRKIINETNGNRRGHDERK